MSPTSKPNIGATMVHIHNAITRGLDVSGERSAAFARGQYPDAAAHEGFVTYVRTLGWAINAHHLTEDHVVFPYLRTRLPNAPYAELSADHRKVELILEELQAAVEAVAAQAQAGDSLHALNQAVTKLVEIWHPHIAKEQLHLYDVEKTAAVMNDDDQIKLITAAAEYGQQQADPAYLMPFVLYNLAPEERAEVAQVIPPVVMQELIPVTWKQKWAPMKAFLLD